MKDTSPTLFGSLRTLLPLLTFQDKVRAVRLLLLSFGAALSELALAGSVALLATFFAAPEKALTQLPAFIRPYVAFLDNDPRYGIVAALLVVIVMVIAKNILAALVFWMSTGLAESIANRVGVRIMQFFYTVPYLWILRVGTPDMLYTFSASSLLGQTLTTFIQIINHICIVFLFFVGLLAIAPIPSLIVFSILALSGQVLTSGLRKAVDSRAERVYQTAYEAHKLQQIGVHSLKELRLYGRGKTLTEHFALTLDTARLAKVSQSIFNRLPVSLLEILGFCTLLLVLIFFIWVQDASIARITAIMGFMAAAAWRLLPIGNRLLEYWAHLRGVLPYIHKTATVMREESTLSGSLLKLHDNMPVCLVFGHNITVDNLSFNYPKATTFALDNLCFSIARGSMVGIVGLSGAGKSTFVNILSGLIPPTFGQILIDDTRLSLSNTPAWMQKIGYVSQAPYILDVSLAENIALSTWGEAPDRERVLECCRMAALDFLDDLPEGIDTMLGERGTRLSGGQAQRVAIARALYSKPELVIFDEATSSLDMRNERAIHETILSLRKQMTLVIIAHRLSAVEGCDQLVWLEQGRVRSAGATETVLPAYTEYLKKQEPQPADAD